MAATVMGGSLRGHIKGVKELVDEGIVEVPQKYIRPAHNRPGSSQVSVGEQIPIIDLTGILGDRRGQIVQEIGRACEEWGFFHVINHGVVLERILGGVRKFYELPAEEKRRLPSHNADSGLTFATGFNSASDQPQDWKDALIIRRRPGVCDGFQEAPEVFREALLEYLSGIQKLADLLYEAIFESLGLTPDDMKTALPGLDRIVLAINFYPPCPDPSLTFALSGHSDVSSFTILLPDDVPGLQVRKGDKWVVVNPVPGAFVINVADQIEILTNGKYPSVEHRVVTNRAKPRTSLAAFFGPTEDTRIAPLAKLVDEKNPAKFRDTIFGEYLRDYYMNNLPLYKTTLNYAKTA